MALCTAMGCPEGDGPYRLGPARKALLPSLLPRQGAAAALGRAGQQEAGGCSCFPGEGQPAGGEQPVEHGSGNGALGREFLP